MHLARTVAIAAAMAVAALTVGVSSAAALENVAIVHTTPGGVSNCPDNIVATGHEATGGCHFNAVSNGNIELQGHVFGIEAHSANCLNNFELRANGAAEGYVQHFLITPGDADCGGSLVRACNESEAHGGGNGQWRFHAEETAARTARALVEVCVVTSALGRCEGNVPVTISELGPVPPPTGTERYRAVVSTAAGINCGSSLTRAEFGGNYDLISEAGDEEVHIIFL